MAVENTLIVITGPTASGKTDLAIELASYFGSDIISADSRQIYRGIPIGTATPDARQLAAAVHHFVGVLDLDQYYSAALFEEQVMALLPELWAKNPVQVMCGGSMMYIDAVTHGIDDLPTISESVRQSTAALLAKEGLQAIIDRLRKLDPDYLAIADLSNQRRLVHALEICIESGVAYSSLRTGRKATRDFNIVKAAIDLPREELFGRINRRVDAMIEDGLVEEARSVAHLRHLNALNTVGYKELFAYFDGNMNLDTAIARIAKNTRVYAKKQLTWLRRAADTMMLRPDEAFNRIIQSVKLI